ncbi:MAG: NAD(+) synthase, partial [Candidatus Gastranaerophilales bacterium]|nr:NAD(+) synthase [Candidatus Gastranaerophilales bacterium]
MTELFTNELKDKILSHKRGSIGIAQINPIAGDIEYNAKKVLKYINLAQNIGLDLVVFPELTLMGYPIEDTIDRYPIIVEDNIKWLKEIAKITTKTAAIIGFIETRNDNISGKKYYNAVAIIQNGKVESIVRKSLLPTYCEFNDYRYFEPSPVVGCQSANTLCNFDESKIENHPKTIIINGIKYGISICEDCWNNKEFFNSNVLYSKDPIEELSKEKPDVFINCSASPTRAKKEQLKYNMLSFISKKYKTPFVYVNQVGAIDNSSFDGSSKVFDSDGKLIARAKSFEEQFLIVNPIKNIGEIYPLTNGPEKTLAEVKEYTLEYDSDLERTYKTILQGIKDYFKKTGFKKAVIGLSGGLDSSVCAVLLADALGKDNVFGISMPSEITSLESKNDAIDLAKNLGINFLEAPVKDVVDCIDNSLKGIFKKVESKWDNRFEDSFTMDNIQARSRAIFLWGISNEFSKTLPIATSDKSELYMGYATINGDMSGGFAPIADVTKTKLFSLAKWL